MTTRRRRIALALTVLSVATLLIITTGLLTAAQASWRYVHFIPLEQPGRWTPVVTAAVAGLAVAGYLGLRNRTAAKAVVSVGATAALMAMCVGAAANVGSVLADDAAQAPAVRVAATADGHLQLVAHVAGSRQYRLRTTGLFGREGRTDVACTVNEWETERPDLEASRGRPRVVMMPAVKVASARFPDAKHVELSMTDGHTWTVQVDGVNPDRTLDWCGKRSSEPS